MSVNINDIIGEVVPGNLQEVIKKQKYPSARAFYTIGGSSLGVWLFNGVGAGIVESFTGKPNYEVYNCDAWLKLSALILSLVIAFIGAEFLKQKTMYDRLVSFFTGLLIFFCATSINSYTAHFFETQKSTEAQTSQMGLIPFRNPAWFPPEALVKEVEIKDQQNQELIKNSDKIIDYVEQELDKTPINQEKTNIPKSDNPTPVNTKSEILNNLANYKASVNKVQQSTQLVSVNKSQIQKQIAVDAEIQGFNSIIVQDFSGALEAFQKSYQAWNVYHNVDEINQLLQKRKDTFAKADAEQKKIIWQEVYCEIVLKYQWGMSGDVRNQFQQKLKNNNFVCSQNQSGK